MGIVVVLLSYAISFLKFAAITAPVLFLLTLWVTRKGTRGRKRALTAALLLPFLDVAFLGVWFLGYAAMNDFFFHRDPGLGDTWYTPVPNGYMLEMIDVMDHGTAYNPKTQNDREGIVSEDDTAFNIVRLQIDGRWMAGTITSDPFAHFRSQTALLEDRFFLLDTGTGKQTRFADLNALTAALSAQGLSLHLRSFWDVFHDYRHTWFDRTAEIFGLLVLLVGFLGFAVYVWRVRQRGRMAPLSS